MSTHEDLQGVGLRPTLPRVEVLDFFRAHAHSHFGAEEVYQLVNGDGGLMSLATVYRALRQLVDTGLICTLTISDGRAVYELNDGKLHDHMVCTECGGIQEFFDPIIEARENAMATQKDFQVSGRQLVMYGVCSACRQTSKPQAVKAAESARVLVSPTQHADED
jgi:Fur family transcriptional regulator, ferric uptake regulator